MEKDKWLGQIRNIYKSNVNFISLMLGSTLIIMGHLNYSKIDS